MNEYERMNFKRLVQVVFDSPFETAGFRAGYIRGMIYSQWGIPLEAFNMVADYGLHLINMEGEAR